MAGFALPYHVYHVNAFVVDFYPNQCYYYSANLNSFLLRVMLTSLRTKEGITDTASAWDPVVVVSPHIIS